MESSKTDQSLLQQAKRDDELAWRRIQQLYRPLLSDWCLQHAITGHDQDNVIMDILEAIRAGLGAFEGKEKGAFRSWLKAISFMACADFWKNNRKSRLKHEAVPKLTAGAAELTVAEDTGANQLEMSMLYKRAFEIVISEFTEETAKIFVAYVVEQKMPEEIAKEFCVERHIVYSAKSRILRRIRQEFEDLLEMD